MTKKDYLLQYIVIVISIITVIVSWFTAYNSVQISWKINKENEAESRNFSIKREVYFEAFQLMQELEKIDDTLEALSILWIRVDNSWSWKMAWEYIKYKELSSNIELVWSRKMRLLWEKLDFYFRVRTLKVLKDKWIDYNFSHYLSWTLSETDEWIYFKNRPLGIILLIKEQIRTELYSPTDEIQFENIDYPVPFIIGEFKEDESLDNYNKRIHDENQKRVDILKQIYTSNSIFP